MKKLLLFVYCLLFLCFQGKKNADDHLDYFLGKWEVKVWTGKETKQEPENMATWFMDKDPDNTGNYKGYVQRGNKVYTSETISWNERGTVYKRTISITTGTKIDLQTKGWIKDQLTWAGIQNDGSNQTRIKEEVTKNDDDHFMAVFYEERDGKWLPTQTELLKRIN